MPETPKEDSAEAHIFELSVFLITTAIWRVHEPKMYGPPRLKEAINRPAEVYDKVGSVDDVGKSGDRLTRTSFR